MTSHVKFVLPHRCNILRLTNLNLPGPQCPWGRSKLSVHLIQIITTVKSSELRLNAENWSRVDSFIFIIVLVFHLLVPLFFLYIPFGLARALQNPDPSHRSS